MSRGECSEFEEGRKEGGESSRGSKMGEGLEDGNKDRGRLRVKTAEKRMRQFEQRGVMTQRS